jgi:hypothetical protein
MLPAIVYSYVNAASAAARRMASVTKSHSGISENARLRARTLCSLYDLNSRAPSTRHSKCLVKRSYKRVVRFCGTVFGVCHHPSAIGRGQD